MRAQFIKSIILVTGAVMTFAGPAHAADMKPYVEIGGASTDVERFTVRKHVSGVVRGGVEITSWAAFEAEGIIGLNDAERTTPGGDRIEDGLDYQIGGYLRLGVPIKKRVLPYVRLGFASAQISDTFRLGGSGETLIRDDTDTFTGPSVGIGIQGYFGEARQHGVRLDLTGVAEIAIGGDEDDEDFGTSNLSLTYVRRF